MQMRELEKKNNSANITAKTTLARQSQIIPRPMDRRAEEDYSSSNVCIERRVTLGHSHVLACEDENRGVSLNILVCLLTPKQRQDTMGGW